jgi:hypothetical protein
MPVRKPAKPWPAHLQELIDSAPPGSGRTLRQVLEQDGLTEDVLTKIGPTTLGSLIEIYERWERLHKHAESLLSTLPGILRSLLEIDEERDRALAELQPWIDRLQGVADRRYHGAKLSAELLRRMRGKITEDHPYVDPTTANNLPLPVAYELLTWTSNEPKGTPGMPGRRRGRKRKPLTPLEDEVWKLYDEKLKGARSPYQDIADMLEPDHPGLKGGEVGRIIRKIKARHDRDMKASQILSDSVTKSRVKGR